jgi:hypothetical protein
MNEFILTKKIYKVYHATSDIALGLSRRPRRLVGSLHPLARSTIRQSQEQQLRK